MGYLGRCNLRYTCMLTMLPFLLDALTSRCVDHACSPPMGNLASGRTLTTLSGCCGNGSHHSPCPTPLHTCPDHLHPPAHMVDDPFLHPDTWWGSGVGTDQVEEVRLDLETRFCLTHVVLLFHSPRPAAMAMERSQDFGRTWETLKLFAQNCSLAFGLPDDTSQHGSRCTSRYSSAKPCSRGEVRGQSVSCTFSEAPASAPFAIYTLLARGTCLCHGHAEHCLPHRGGQDTLKDMVSVVAGRCVCTHHTAGEHCERCGPLYNDQSWKPANGSSGEPHPCHKCECHGHAESCHFSKRAWLSLEGTSGGVCDDCQHNTAGRRCQRCRHGYHRQPAMPLNSPHICTPISGEEGRWCHPRSGQCHCRPGVGGTGCNHCLPGYWGFGGEGCNPCACPQNCDPHTGLCKILAMDHALTTEGEPVWSKQLAVSALHYTGKCSCKERKLRSVSDLCKTKYAYVIKASVLSAHDKGSHAEVQVKVRKVLRSGQVPLSQGTHSIYPLSWTSRGCTCPILNPGSVEYLLAGPEEVETERLLVTMQSVVVPWTPQLGTHISEGLRQGCPEHPLQTINRAI
uniref:Si:dkey-202e22.2 n=1 Tax=Oncorhynchus mykiss TaxID=8022 RepID=A0A8K9XUL1_ONCMY